MRFFLFFAIFFCEISRASPVFFSSSLHSFYGCVSYTLNGRVEIFISNFMRIGDSVVRFVCSRAHAAHSIRISSTTLFVEFLSCSSLFFSLFRFCFLFVCTTHISCICHFSGCYEYSFIIRSFCVSFLFFVSPMQVDQRFFSCLRCFVSSQFAHTKRRNVITN